MKQADYIIVGGGIMGCALFYELTKQRKNVILLEQGQVASKITGQSGGFIRKINPDNYISLLSNESFNHYQSFEHEVGLPCGFVKTGLTYTVTQKALDVLQKNILELNSEIYPITISKERSDKILIHEENAGYIDTQQTCRNWVHAANTMGGSCYEQVHVKEILVNKGSAYGLNTTNGVIKANNIILATGALTHALLAPLEINVDLDIKSFQYNIYPAAARHLNTAHLNMLDGFYLFPKNGDVLAGFLNEDELVKTFNDRLDNSLAQRLHHLLSGHFPFINNHTYVIKKSYDAYTKDHRGWMEQTSVQGLFAATGLSGGGIKIAPFLAKYFGGVLNEQK